MDNKVNSETNEKISHPRTQGDTGLKHFPSLTTSDCEAIEKFQRNLDKKFIELKEQFNLSNIDMADLFDPYIKESSRVSNIASSAFELVSKGKRHVNWKVMAAMYLIFGQSIDEILSQSITPRPLDQRPDKAQLKNN